MTRSFIPKTGCVRCSPTDPRPEYPLPALRDSETYHVCESGLKSERPALLMNASEKNGWRLDRLAGGVWMVSQGELEVGLFRDLNVAMRFFLQRSRPERYGPG